MPFQDLPDRLSEIQERIRAAASRGFGQQVTLVAVTKTYGPDAVEAAWAAGIRDVGENRVQEALPKRQATSVPVNWHLIGHLQRNKVKALDHFELLQSLDSLRLAEAVHAHGIERARAMESLVQVNVSGEGSKGGFSPGELESCAGRLAAMPGLVVRGVMTMAPLGASETELRRVFAGARAVRDSLRSAGLPAADLSMGMSSDYEVAVEEGATCVRLGTILFGARAA
ncbi:MAG: hypothetical protein JWO05_2279 [Gemmatimonadetes bacterium]|nr:hypothetical protein [Gemmatimonadota bacterium]